MEYRQSKKKLKKQIAFDFEVEDVTICDEDPLHKQKNKEIDKENVLPRVPLKERKILSGKRRVARFNFQKTKVIVDSNSLGEESNNSNGSKAPVAKEVSQPINFELPVVENEESKSNSYTLERTVTNIDTLISNSIIDPNISLPFSMITSNTESDPHGNSTFEVSASESYLDHPKFFDDSKLLEKDVKNKGKLLNSILKRKNKESRKSAVTFKLPEKQKSPKVAIKKIVTSTPKIITKSPGKSTSVKKMPNFAEIHKKALDRQENIHEYLVRKGERAKALSTGIKQKPQKHDMPRSEKQSKRQLDFSVKKTEKKSLQKHTPDILRKNKSATSAEVTPEDRFVNKIRFRKQTPAAKSLAVTKLPKDKPIMAKQDQLCTPILTNTFNAIPVNTFDAIQANTKFGSKLDTKKDEVKAAMAAKTKVQKDTRSENRNLVKGVRTNRRFDLIMNMRLGKKNVL